jgi:two-component system, OmpR family, sensor histidine kinase VicK
VAVDRDVTEMVEFDLSKDQFIRVAAHELKTPIAIMKGYAQLLLRSSDKLPPAMIGSLAAVERGANRIDHIVNDLLDLSQLQVGRMDLKPEKIDLAELVEVVTQRVALTTKRHELRVLEAEPVVVRGDRTRLEQVLANLLDNAIRYSPRGGKIEVSLTVSDGTADVSVRDHGVGIPANKQARVFECFYRPHTDTPYDYGGMGVGLFVSREIVRRHGGTMSLVSKEGSGSVFSFRLPV